MKTPEEKTYKISLVSRITEEGLSTRKIQEEIASRLGESKSLPQPKVPFKIIEQIKELVTEDNLRQYDTSKDKLGKLHVKRQEKLRKEAEDLRDKLPALMKLSESVLSNLDELRKEREDKRAAKRAKTKAESEDDVSVEAPQE
jgi:hypothetical protein